MISDELRKRVIEKSYGKCAVCGRADVPLDIEHILPMPPTGNESDEPLNLRAICRSCNLRLSNRPLNERAIVEEQSRKGYELEELVANVFRQAGFAIVSSATSYDGGQDLFARTIDPITNKPITIAVQCKWRTDALSSEDLLTFKSNVDNSASDYGLLVTNARPSRHILDLARSTGIAVVTSNELDRFVRDFREVRSNE